MKPNPHIALIYHYDLARALNGEPTDWVAIPVNVDAGREGGDLCRAAADFAKRRDLFAMSKETPCTDTTTQPGETADSLDGSLRTASNSVPESDASSPTCTSSPKVNTSNTSQTEPPSSNSPPDQVAAPAAPNAVGQPVAEPPAPARSAAQVSAANVCRDCGRPLDPGGYCLRPECPRWSDDYQPELYKAQSAFDRDRLRARIADLIDAGHEQTIRAHWPPDVASLRYPCHTPDELEAILKCVRSVETFVGAGWHPDDGPPPHVNTDPRAEVAYPEAEIGDGGMVDVWEVATHSAAFEELDDDARALCHQIAAEAHAAGRSISVSANPTVRRWSIARAVIAWAATGRSVDDLLAAVTMITDPPIDGVPSATADVDATLGGLVSQFTVEQADRLYEAAGR